MSTTWKIISTKAWRTRKTKNKLQNLFFMALFYFEKIISLLILWILKSQNVFDWSLIIPWLIISSSRSPESFRCSLSIALPNSAYIQTPFPLRLGYCVLLTSHLKQYHTVTFWLFPAGWWLLVVHIPAVNNRAVHTDFCSASGHPEKGTLAPSLKRDPAEGLALANEMWLEVGVPLLGWSFKNLHMVLLPASS